MKNFNLAIAANMKILFDANSESRTRLISISAPVEIIAFGLEECDVISFDLAHIGRLLPNTAVDGCAIIDNTNQGLPVEGVAPYTICGKPVMANSLKPRVVIERPGYYIVSFDGASLGSAIVYMQAASDAAILEHRRDCFTDEALKALCCEDVEFTVQDVTETSFVVNIVSGGEVYAKLSSGEQMQKGVGPFVFDSLKPNEPYSIVVYNECGKEAIKIAKTLPCPIPVLAVEGSTVNSATVRLVSGGPATLRLGNAKAHLQDGELHTFAGLAPNTIHQVEAISDCACGDCAAAVYLDLQTAECPAVAATFESTTSTISVTVTGGAPANVIVNGVTKRADANGNVIVFSGLMPDTEYTATVASACGNDAIFEFATQPCPAPVLTLVSATTSSITVELSGAAPADVTTNGVTRTIATVGGQATFDNLPSGSYQFKATTDCSDKVYNFEFATLPCPVVDFTITGVTTDGFTYTPTAGTPHDVIIRNEAGSPVESAEGVTVATAFTGLPEERLSVMAVNECGKTKVRYVTILAPVVVEDPCPSYPLLGGGFAYFAVDGVPAEATQQITVNQTIGGVVQVPFNVFISPTRVAGHTHAVRNAANGVIGFAANTSCCAPNGCLDSDDTETYEVA